MPIFVTLCHPLTLSIGGSDITDSKFDGLCFTLRCKVLSFNGVGQVMAYVRHQGEKEVVHVLAAEDKPTRQKWVESLLLAISMFAKDSQFYMVRKSSVDKGERN